MNAANPNLSLFESVVATLGPLCARFVFVGGCITGLLVTEAASPPVRATRDVDAIVQLVSLGDYHALERQLEQAGLRHDRSPDAPICRRLAGTALVDIMPTDESVLGFRSRWYEEAVRTALTAAEGVAIAPRELPPVWPEPGRRAAEPASIRDTKPSD